jgi:hypothetical protein
MKDIEIELEGVIYKLGHHSQNVWYILVDYGNHGHTVSCRLEGNQLVGSDDLDNVPLEIKDYFCKCLKLLAFW